VLKGEINYELEPFTMIELGMADPGKLHYGHPVRLHIRNLVTFQAKDLAAPETKAL